MGDDFAGAHDALDRMKRAYGRGTGCHLTAEMIASLSVTVIGQMWDDDRPPPRCGLAPASSEGDRE